MRIIILAAQKTPCPLPEISALYRRARKAHYSTMKLHIDKLLKGSNALILAGFDPVDSLMLMTWGAAKKEDEDLHTVSAIGYKGAVMDFQVSLQNGFWGQGWI